MIDTLMLSRLQFAANISFHILFPTITIALCWYLFYFKLRYEFSQDAIWMRIYRFWVKIFALTFALGVVTGITMSFQFGTNWPGFMEKVGNIAGPLLGYEVLTAFFLEATFLSIMLFGINRIPSKLHTFATLMVAIGTSLSAFWILALNSWMQTPQGFEMRNGVAFPTDWFAIIFNPSFPYRLSHMMLASGLTASFLIIGISAYRLLKGDDKKAPKKAMNTAISVACVLTVAQIFVGDMHGLNTLKHQPEKIAAVEAIWHTERGAPLVLFALPNEQTKHNDFAIEIPYGASAILTHKLDGELKGLNEFDQHPPVKPLFFGFRIMVGLGFLMLFVVWVSKYLQLKHKTLPKAWLKLLTWMTFSGWVATLAGWIVTEVGRQPYLVHGVLTTKEAATTIASGNVALSLTLYCTTYVFLMWAYLHTIKVMANRAIAIEEMSQDELNPSKMSNQQNQEPAHV